MNFVSLSFCGSMLLLCGFDWVGFHVLVDIDVVKGPRYSSGINRLLLCLPIFRSSPRLKRRGSSSPHQNFVGRFLNFSYCIPMPHNMMVNADAGPSNEESEEKKKRTSHACVSCRAAKVRRSSFPPLSLVTRH